MMILTFTVNGEPHAIEVPEVDELTIAIEQVHETMLAACNGGIPHKYLQARITEALLNALVEQTDVSVGEVLACPTEQPEPSGDVERAR